ncbi:PP2C family protein-serine/threonine phosphatase [Noviherbaspirillum galbum]|uniref:SpoIIE family protein phosphatase n=1 Tax=Noviherbaspirillum galbum TaxID=2709383 RepID=A0A6B3SSK2_9BURK|nr:GAF domain-containing SpoIIE family protein phosphatase [Noviherbaspirillum galbum]NEX63930.1 SpoIIE family protein phosphatase [Noviherbaspirillum galbum]
MASSSILTDESARLENLYSHGLLDTPFEVVFDEIASLAAKICGVPYGMVTVLDGKRQWIKAARGLDVQEISRDISFCSYTIQQDDVFYVPDMLADERFASNPFVTGPLAIRVYAGAPVVSDEGYKLGTVCVLSDRPQALDNWQLDALRQLSQVVRTLFSARRKESELERERIRLQEALERRHHELDLTYRRLSEEMELARELQHRFLPAYKRVFNVTFDWLFRASSYLSGDLFDYFPLDQRYLCFHVCDVAGHGVASALLAFGMQRQLSAARFDMAAYLQRMNGDLRRAIRMIAGECNRRFLSLNESGLYATMVIGVIDAETGEGALVQAGHPHPLMIAPGSGQVSAIGEGGLPIGMFPDAEYDACGFHLQTGSRLFLYSDGILDCENPDQAPFGRQRFERILSDFADAPLDQAKKRLEQALLEWHGRNRGFSDDITFLALEYRGRLTGQVNTPS